jgi:hypothetical protein
MPYSRMLLSFLRSTSDLIQATRHRNRRTGAIPFRGAGRKLINLGALSGAMLCAGCEPSAPPPPSLFFAGLPVSGNLADAHRARFDDCFNMDAVHMRCRRHGVILDGQGPYEAAVDLRGGRGESGFDQLILWHDSDQTAVYRVTERLKNKGWQFCFSGTDRWGDQAVFTRGGMSLRISMDLSYWGKRRLRLMPDWNRRELDKPCTPQTWLPPQTNSELAATPRPDPQTDKR